MFPLAGQTAGLNGLKFFEGTKGIPGVTQAKKLNIFFQHFFILFCLFLGQRQALHLVSNITESFKEKNMFKMYKSLNFTYMGWGDTGQLLIKFENIGL